MQTPATDTELTDIILSALNRAAYAHGLHEAETGEHDEEWPQWYAEHMARTLQEDGYLISEKDPQ